MNHFTAGIGLLKIKRAQLSQKGFQPVSAITAIVVW
jgi:hypothetical protein